MADPIIDGLLEEIIVAGKSQGLDQKKIAARAGVGASTLSKAKASGDLRVSTLARLAHAVGLRISLSPNDPTLSSLLNRQLFGS